MIVPDKILEKWNALKDKSDMTNIKDETGLSYYAIKNVFDKKDTTLDVITAIGDYYEKKIKVLKSYVQ